MRLDIAKRMDAFINPDRNRRTRGECCDAIEIGGLERLLEEQQAGAVRPGQILLRSIAREAAIRVGAQRHRGPERRAHR